MCYQNKSNNREPHSHQNQQCKLPGIHINPYKMYGYQIQCNRIFRTVKNHKRALWNLKTKVLLQVMIQMMQTVFSIITHQQFSSSISASVSDRADVAFLQKSSPPAQLSSLHA